MTSRIQLPAPGELEGLAGLLMVRRSVRDFATGSVTLAEIARLFWAGQGISHSSGKHTVPSARALSPISLYLVAGDVADVPQGLYVYEPRVNALDAVGYGDLRGDLYHAALEDQPWIRDCAALIIIAGEVRRMQEAFADQPPQGTRGVRYVYMEAGAAAQNVALQAAELELGTVLVGGFDDEGVRRLLAVEPAPLILMPVGRTIA